MGDFDGAVESFSEAVRLDPLSAHMLEDLGSTYAHARRHEEAIEVFRKSLTLAPDVGPYAFMFTSLLSADGNTTRARQLIDEGEAATGERMSWLDVTVRELDGDVQGALHIADSLEFTGNWMGALLAAAGRPEEAEEFFRGQLEFSQGRLAELDASERLARFPARANTLIDIAQAQAGLGMLDEAAASAEAAMEALPVSVDAMDGPGVMYDAAAVLVKAGYLDRAVEVLTAFFAGPGEQSFAYLEMDPAFDALRDHPGYPALGS
jgi:tetratricopeptide (TPR) repeat protein